MSASDGAPLPPATAAALGYEDFGLNFGALFYIYLALSVLACALAAGQFYFHVASITGFWLVPAPCILALPVLYVWSAQQRALPPGAAAAAPPPPKAHKE